MRMGGGTAPEAEAGIGVGACSGSVRSIGFGSGLLLRFAGVGVKCVVEVVGMDAAGVDEMAAEDVGVASRWSWS